MSEAPQWLADPALERVWEGIRLRLESTGGAASGKTTVTLTSRTERHAVGALIGRSVTTDRVALDLEVLERRVVDRAGFGSLAAACRAVTDRPLRDRPGERAAREARRHRPVELARELAQGPWVDPWLAGLTRSGLLARADDGEQLIRDAVLVLDEVLTHAGEPRSRVELAARLVGDAHAIDEDTVLHQVVLRGLAAAANVELPVARADRRALWEKRGVSPDLLSATCLTVGLRPIGRQGFARRLRSAADSGDPVHVTAWDLRRLDGASPPRSRVLVCENPRVLEAVAERLAGDVPAVCTSGQPNTVVTKLLGWLRVSGCELLYHGDFDWPGVAIANWMVTHCDVRPWLMGVADYEAGIRRGSPRLAGAPVEPSWDLELGPAMRAHAVGVHEESLLDHLLARAEQWD